MRLSPVELGFLGLAVIVAATAIPRCGSGGRSAVRASWALTPGVLNPAVTQATIRSTICRHGWTRTVRPPVDFTNALKQRQLRLYGLRGPPSAYQEDHLISLELAATRPIRATCGRSHIRAPRRSTRSRTTSTTASARGH